MAKFDPIIGRYVYVQCGSETYRTYYEENGQGIPLVCLHTAGTDGREWRHQLCDPEITKNFRVIAFDLPPDADYADFVNAVLPVTITTATVMGIYGPARQPLPAQ